MSKNERNLTNTQQIYEPARLLRLKEVISQTGLARSTIYDLMGRGEFPKSFKITERSTAWLESDIQEWIENKIANREGSKRHGE